jgi:SAM-dependent methyltransferase
MNNKVPDHNSPEPYDFRGNLTADCRALIPVINLLGDNLVGAEIGVFQADSLMTMLHNCLNIKTLYGVDSYQPYHDYLRTDGITDVPVYTMDLKTIRLIRAEAMNRIEYSGMPGKVIFYEEDTSVAVKKFDDESLDFIFLDTCMTPEQAREDLSDWYDKVKPGGLFSGHDWNSPEVAYEVMEFRKKNNITSRMSSYDNTYMWIK